MDLVSNDGSCMESIRRTDSPARMTAIELFAGVGGFRLGLERTGWQVTWSNQWEPSTRAQHASECYVRHFGDAGHVNDDISKVLDSVEAQDGTHHLPEHTLLVGGFPCQDYSVAKSLNSAHGIEGKKGVLWWDIHRLLELKRPAYVLLENVDRLLKSPARQRGRDFAVILSCFSGLGYSVQWRVVDSSDYGFPQRRKRVFLLATRDPDILFSDATGPLGALDLITSGVLASALPISAPGDAHKSLHKLELDRDIVSLSSDFGTGLGRSPFMNAGVMIDNSVWTTDVKASYSGPRSVLGDVLQPIDDVPQEYFIPDERYEAWRYLKGAKREERVHKASGAKYYYAEGGIAFPDWIDRPSRTILTGEGGTGPSRFKHIIKCADGRHRRLTPIELERLNGFDDDWTAGMPDGRRAFCMGNALVVGIVERIGDALGTHIRTMRTSEPVASVPCAHETLVKS